MVKCQNYNPTCTSKNMFAPACLKLHTKSDEADATPIFTSSNLKFNPADIFWQKTLSVRSVERFRFSTLNTLRCIPNK